GPAQQAGFFQELTLPIDLEKLGKESQFPQIGLVKGGADGREGLLFRLAVEGVGVFKKKFQPVILQEGAGLGGGVEFLKLDDRFPEIVPSPEALGRVLLILAGKP